MLLASLPSRIIAFLLVWVAHGWQHQQRTWRTRRAAAGSGGGLALSRRPWGLPALPHCHGGHPWISSGRHSAPGNAAGASHRPANRDRRRLASSVSDNDGAASGPPNQQDDDCPSEEECEIDWDKMPGFAEDDSVDNGAGGGEDRSQEAASTKSSAARTMGRAEPARSVESTRLRLEMMWQLEEAAEDCEVERPETCGSRPCGRCRGRGANACRFCSGRQVLGFRRERPDGTTQPALYGCTVCDRGFEACDACRGTGWVAEWALLTPGTSTPAAAH